MDVLLPKLYVRQSGSLRGFGALDDKQQIVQALNDVQAALVKVANNRQETVTATIIQRQKGLVLDRRFYDSFEYARARLLDAAQAVDEQLDVIERADPALWVKILGDFNKYASRIPGVNMSSPSVYELISMAVPAIPAALMAPQDSAASMAAVNMELARYETKPGSGLNGLGFFQTLIGAATGSTCLTLAATAGLLTAGTGAVVIGAACILAGIAVTVAATAVAITLIRRLPTSAATALAASDSLSNALDQVNETCKRNNLSPKDCAELAKKAADNTKPPKGNLDIPWGVVAAVGVGVALWFFWPVIVGKARAARASQVAGLRRRRRSR